METRSEPFAGAQDRDTPQERQLRLLELNAATARALAAARDGEGRADLLREIERLRAECANRDRLIEHLKRPLLVRALRRLAGKKLD